MADKRKKIYSIPVLWTMWDAVEVEADSLEEAVEFVKENIDDLPRSKNGQYLEGSFRMDDGSPYGEASVEEAIEHLRRILGLPEES